MKTYLFEAKQFSVAVRWDEDRAVEILLCPQNPILPDSPLPPQVMRFFKEVKGYLEGKDVDLSLPVDYSRLSPFAKKVSEELLKTHCGEVISYGELARRVGNPKAARAVGRVMAKNPFPLVIPCHRVIGSNGSLTGFGAGLELKKRLLELEAGIKKA